MTTIFKLISFTGILFFFVLTMRVSSVQAGYVKGYYKSNGTYVNPYYRSNPNAYTYDNYSYTDGNRYNPSYYAPTKNYSSTWYTPSYETQPDYYYGKNVYDSNHYSYHSYDDYYDNGYNLNY